MNPMLPLKTLKHLWVFTIQLVTESLQATLTQNLSLDEGIERKKPCHVSVEYHITT